MISTVRHMFSVTGNLEFRGHHLEFPASGLVDQHHNHYHRITGPQNIEIAVVISFLSCLQAEKLLLPLRRPPYWISHFRVGRKSFHLVQLDCLTPTHGDSRWNFVAIYPRSYYKIKVRVVTTPPQYFSVFLIYIHGGLKFLPVVPSLSELRFNYL